MDIIPAVAGNQPRVISAEFIKLTIYNDATNPDDTSIYTFSSAYQYETIGGEVYSPAGGLLAVGIQQRDLSVTSALTSISLSGIDGYENMWMVLEKKIKGSKIEIWRGFYDENQVLNTTTSPPVKRFTGIITSYNIGEERANQDDNFTVTVNASSYKLVLQNRTAGRRTNPNSWQQFFPADTSMTWISSLSGRAFDFGVPPNPNLKPAAGSSVSSGTDIPNYVNGA